MMGGWATDTGQQEWRMSNPDRMRRYREYGRQQRAMQSSALSMMKLEAGCADCGFDKDPAALDFDHVRGEKHFSVGQNNHRAMSRVLEEVDKCDVVCANCHRIRTANRLAGKEGAPLELPEDLEDDATSLEYEEERT